MHDRSDRLDLARLAVPAALVVLGVFTAIRWLGIDPWAMPAYDAFAYWRTRDGLDYSATHQGITGAYLYSPLFAQLIAPLTALPWTVFLALWTLLLALPILWLAGRYALPLLLLPPVFMSVALGQLDLVFAAVAILGLRWPVLWSLPVLTKITPGIGLLWFVVRGEWRALGLAGLATAAVVLVSAAIDPAAWAGWIGLLGRMDFPELGGGLWFLPLPLWFRLFVAAALIAWGAAGDRRWVVPVGMCLSLPTVWINSPTILIALLPLAAAGARARIPAAAWVRRNVRRGPVPAFDLEDGRRRLERWIRQITEA